MEPHNDRILFQAQTLLALSTSSLAFLLSCVLAWCGIFIIAVLHQVLLWIIPAIFILLIHLYFYLRFCFDQGLLAQLIDAQQQGTSIAEFTTQLDQSLIFFKLVKASHNVRNWDDRFTGIMRLFRYFIGSAVLMWLYLIGLIIGVVLCQV
ncbi:hypothetical protein SAMN05421749_11135 [Acinetobacter marinus]|uniref:Uncharacterized protein n=1 Tax=Acinetobacter marinus TaxID=281375 RepID=A0A1G6NXX3_9GAMM|nr:hypothetical protein [Acinetobacter marinus]SDC72501.1 hypothetical protein SAMN05421749_11135 [Acinetobacter marinus]